MTRWTKLHELLTGEPILTPLDIRLRDALAERDAAAQAHDDRRYGRALMELRQVQIERLEIGA